MFTPSSSSFFLPHRFHRSRALAGCRTTAMRHAASSDAAVRCSSPSLEPRSRAREEVLPRRVCVCVEGEEVSGESGGGASDARNSTRWRVWRRTPRARPAPPAPSPPVHPKLCSLAATVGTQRSKRHTNNTHRFRLLQPLQAAAQVEDEGARGSVQLLQVGHSCGLRAARTERKIKERRLCFFFRFDTNRSCSLFFSPREQCADRLVPRSCCTKVRPTSSKPRTRGWRGERHSGCPRIVPFAQRSPYSPRPTPSPGLTRAKSTPHTTPTHHHV